MNTLFKKIAKKILRCSKEDELVNSLYSTINEAIIKKEISLEQFVVLSREYLNKGKKLGLQNEDQYNKHFCYQFRQNLYGLENTYNSILGT